VAGEVTQNGRFPPPNCLIIWLILPLLRIILRMSPNCFKRWFTWVTLAL
jgi:hypothetical protein